MMANRDEIFAIVGEVLRQEFDFAIEDLRLETSLVDDLDLDSIDAIDMAVRIEERTGVRFEDEELKAVKTIRDVVDQIDGRL
jgi:acyl carrier protein